MRLPGRSSFDCPRRCGRIDLVALERAVAINGINGLCTAIAIVSTGPDRDHAIALRRAGGAKLGLG